MQLEISHDLFRRRLAFAAGAMALTSIFHVGGAGAQGQLTAAPAPDQKRLQLSFHRNGSPAKADVIYAAGATRLSFDDVEKIDAAVPDRGTLTIVSSDGVFKDVLPVYQIPSSGKPAEVHLPYGDPAGYEPLLLFKESGASIQLENRIDGSRGRGGAFRLSTLVRGPVGSAVVLDTMLSIGRDANAHACKAPCLHAYPSQAAADCSVHCYTCSTTAYYEGYWRENFNMCESLTAPTGGGGGVSDEGRLDIASDFAPIPEGQGGVALAAALRDDRALFPTEMILRHVETGAESRLAPPYRGRSYPDFVVPAGRYVLTIKAPDWEKTNITHVLSVPLEARSGAIETVYVAAPPTGAVGATSARALGDTRLGLALKSVAAEKMPNGAMRVTAEVDAGRADQAWVTVRTKAARTALSVFAVTDSGKRELTFGSDYLVSRNGRFDDVTLRIEGGTGVFELTR